MVNTAAFKDGEEPEKDMLIHVILASLMRCGHRVGDCAVMCVRDVASTLKGYYRDKTLGHIDTGYSYSDSFTEGKYEDSLEYVASGYTAITAMLRHLTVNGRRMSLWSSAAAREG